MARRNSDSMIACALAVNPTLFEVLRKPDLCSAFRNFCERHRCLENITFWLEVEEFKAIDDPSERQARANEMVQKYFGEESVHEICVSSETKANIVANLSQPEKELFDELQGLTFLCMKDDIYLKFIVSRDYYMAMGLPDPNIREINSDPESYEEPGTPKRKGGWFVCGKAED